MRRTIPIDVWPRHRTVVEFRLTDVEPSVARWWLVVAADQAEVCDFDPGFDVDALLTSSLRTLTEIWRGDLTWPTALRTEVVGINGTEDVRRALPSWLGQSSAAHVRRPRAGGIPTRAQM